MVLQQSVDTLNIIIYEKNIVINNIINVKNKDIFNIYVYIKLYCLYYIWIININILNINQNI